MLFLYPNHYTFFFPEQFFEFYTFARLHSVTPEWVTRELIMQTSMRRRQRTYCNKTHQEKKKKRGFFFSDSVTYERTWGGVRGIRG